MIDVRTSVEGGSVTPVYGSHSGPESDTTMMRQSNIQNIRIVGRFGVSGELPASRAFLRRRCKTKSGMKQAIAKIGAVHSHVSERPSGLRKMAINRNNDPNGDNAVSNFNGFTSSNLGLCRQFSLVIQRISRQESIACKVPL
jgi:hypothetical protein